MDEPFSALDAQNKLLLQEELLRIWEEHKKTVVFITHSVDEAVLLGDRIMVMTAQPGRIKQFVRRPAPPAAQRHGTAGAPAYGELVLSHLGRSARRGPARPRVADGSGAPDEHRRLTVHTHRATAVAAPAAGACRCRRATAS